MDSADNWTGQWVAKKIEQSEGVVSVQLAASNILIISRNRNPRITAATLAEDAVTAEVLKQAIGGREDVQFVVNVPRGSYFEGDALRYATNQGFGLGGLGDLVRAVRMRDVTKYVPPTIEFIERGLRQHDRVDGFERRADLSYLLHRTDGLGDIHVVFLHEYELVADHLRVARDRYGKFDLVVITNPCGNATLSADLVAAGFGCRVYKWGEFLGALHR